MSKLKGNIEIKLEEVAMVAAMQIFFNDIMPYGQAPYINGVRYSPDLKLFIITAKAPK